MQIDEIVKLVNPPKGEDAIIVEEMQKFGIIGQSKVIIDAFLKLKKAARSEANILMEGESGTGKEIFATTAHMLSRRASKRLVKISCAEIPETLLESELFGYEKGAFTGAERRKIGKFELANDGTIFLDEIGEISLNLQSKLLRVIENKTISRVGGLDIIPVDVRVISATNRNLWEEVKRNKFREDLYYRLNVVFLKLPSLKERMEDIPLLTKYFIDLYSNKENKRIESIDREVLNLFFSIEWKGNVRHLENIIHHAIIMSEDGRISLKDLPENIFHITGRGSILENEKFVKKDDLVITESEIREIEKAQIIVALEKTHWKISEAAALLGIHRNTLRQKMSKFKITR
ncbi:MAG: sigma-54 interaction domain-containing protein [Brevinematia bacterium]